MLYSEKYIKINRDVAEQSELHEGFRIFVVVQDPPVYMK